MSESKDTWSIKDFFGGLVGGGIIAGLGIWMIINPDGAGTTDAEGRRSMIKNLLNAIWSIPGGIVVTIIGLVIVWLTIDQIRSQLKRK